MAVNASEILTTATEETAPVVATSAGYYSFPVPYNYVIVSNPGAAALHVVYNLAEGSAASASSMHDVIEAASAKEVTRGGRYPVSSVSAWPATGGSADVNVYGAHRPIGG